MSSEGFGKIHELTTLERDIRNELALIRERIYLVKQALEDFDVRVLFDTPDTVEKHAMMTSALDNAMAAVKRLRN